MRTVSKYIMGMLMLLVVMQGCTRMDLYELSTKVNLKLNLNMQINMNLDMEIDTDLDKEFSDKVNGVMPEYMEVMFYDVESGARRASFILPVEGGTVSVAPGDYHIVAYNFGTESTQVDNLGNLNNAKAFTTNITKLMESKFKAIIANAPKTPGDSISQELNSQTKGYEDDPIIHEPDHLYVANEERINVPAVIDQDMDITIHATAKTILDIYSLEVIGVTGCENIEKVEAFITGQIEENYFGLAQRGSDPATVYITLKVDPENGRLYTVFGTFGKLKGANNKIFLDITVTNTDGGQYRYVYDVTEQFDDENNDNNKLVVRDIIDIPAGSEGGGGLDPSVDEWDKEDIEIPLT